MERSQWYIGSLNSVVLCVDHIDRCQMNGSVYHAYCENAIEITNMSQLLFELERFFDSIGFPFPYENVRSFREKRQCMQYKKERVRVVDDQELLNKQGDLGTFIIRVQHRQNSSWQGRITWKDKNKTLYFRSVWEMVKLMASALETVCEEDMEEDMGEESWLES